MCNLLNRLALIQHSIYTVFIRQTFFWISVLIPTALFLYNTFLFYNYYMAIVFSISLNNHSRDLQYSKRTTEKKENIILWFYEPQQLHQWNHLYLKVEIKDIILQSKKWWWMVPFWGQGEQEYFLRSIYSPKSALSLHIWYIF